LNLTHSNGKLRGLIVVAAWASVAAVVYATLSKLQLIYRLYYLLAPYLNYPSMQTYATLEHLVAYGIVGILFSALYPRSLLRVFFFLFLFIVGLEILQTFTPDRHGTLHDALEKMIGAAMGAVLMMAVLSWRRNRRVRKTAEPG
jgi:VanZ family protein